MTVAQLVRRLPPVLVLTAALAVAATLLATPATAAKKKSKQAPCAEQVVADWYDNGRIDVVYPLRCYREAIKSLPPDVKDYSTAKEEIERALADATNRPRVTKPTPLASVPCLKGRRCSDPPSAGRPPTPNGKGGPYDPTGTPTANPDEPDTSGPSSIPIPLIVLGGLALLLLAAGSAGYLARRFGHGGDGDGGEPPAPA